MQIINSIRSKDKNALESLYNNYGIKLFSFARTNWNLSEDDGWELVYNTLFKVIEVIDRYDFKNEKHFQNWIYKIFKNELFQFYRRNENKASFKDFVSLEAFKTKQIEPDEDWQKVSDGIGILNNISNEDYLLQEETVNPTIVALENALNEIGDFNKQLLLLRAQGFTYEEVASFLGVDKKNLKVKYLRAKQKVIKLLAEKMED